MPALAGRDGDGVLAHIRAISRLHRPSCPLAHPN
jgi:hypothetical protein